MEQITVVTTSGKFEFEGKHRRDLEKPNWHYYELITGKIIHFRKEHMIAVIDGEWRSQIDYETN